MDTEKTAKTLSARQSVTVIAVSFTLAYGLHYLAYFLRARYYALLESPALSAAASHVLMYAGHIFFLIFMALYGLAVKEDRKYLLAFLPKKGRKDLLWLLLGALTGLFLMCVCVLSAKLHGDITVLPGRTQNYGVFVIALLTVFVQAATEEIESRGFLFGRMKGAGVPVAAAIPVSAFFFSYFHAANPGFGFVPLLSIFIVGVQYALCYHYFGNLWFTFGAHTLWNFTQDFVFGLPDSGKPAAVSLMNTTVNKGSFFYHTEFGIEGSWMAICVNLLACAAIFLLGRKMAEDNGDR